MLEAPAEFAEKPLEASAAAPQGASLAAAAAASIAPVGELAAPEQPLAGLTDQPGEPPEARAARLGLKLPSIPVTPRSSFVPLPRDIRVYIVGAIGGDYAQGRLRRVEGRMAKWMGPGDVISHVCEEGGLERNKGRVKNIFEVPYSPDGLRNFSDCMSYRFKNRSHADMMKCDEKKTSQIKFAYGLVHEIRRLSALGGPMPRWWVLKDDDTYVNVEHLMMGIERHTSNMSQPAWENNLSFQAKCARVCGGAGWVISRGLAKVLLGPLGDQWVYQQMTNILTPERFSGYDQHLHGWLLKPTNATTIVLDEMNAFAPMSEACDWKPIRAPSCHYSLPGFCNCSRSLRPATFHLKGNWKVEMDALVENNL